MNRFEDVFFRVVEFSIDESADDPKESVKRFFLDELSLTEDEWNKIDEDVNQAIITILGEI